MKWWGRRGLTLALTPSWTSGTLGMASYREETYVMMDFSSGWSTSTSVERDDEIKMLLFWLILTVRSWIKAMHSSNVPWVKRPGWFWICDSSHPLGPTVWWLPGLSLPRWRPAPGSPGWTVGTRYSCRSEWACGQKPDRENSERKLLLSIKTFIKSCVTAANVREKHSH